MKRFIPGPLPENARNLMRRIGYGEHRGFGGEVSFAKRIHGMAYPRWHAYVEDRDGGMQINLHLDQKQASHEGSRAHSGEYEGAIVEREMARIADAIARLPVGHQTSSSETPKKKRGFWDVLFG